MNIKNFKSFTTKSNGKLIKEEVDFTLLSQIPEMISQFTQWLNTSHEDATGVLYKNWHVVASVLAAIGMVGGAFTKAYLNFSKEMKAAINQRIADAIAANPDADPKEIANKIISDQKNLG